MIKKLQGKLTWHEKFWDDDVEYYEIDNCDISYIFSAFENKNVCITIKEIPEQQEDDEPTVNLTLRTVIRNEYLCNALGYDPYCIKEGADGDAMVQVKLSDFRKAGLL